MHAEIFLESEFRAVGIGRQGITGQAETQDKHKVQSASRISTLPKPAPLGQRKRCRLLRGHAMPFPQGQHGQLTLAAQGEEAARVAVPVAAMAIN